MYTVPLHMHSLTWNCTPAPLASMFSRHYLAELQPDMLARQPEAQLAQRQALGWQPQVSAVQLLPVEQQSAVMGAQPEAPVSVPEPALRVPAAGIFAGGAPAVAQPLVAGPETVTV